MIADEFSDPPAARGVAKPVTELAGDVGDGEFMAVVAGG